eukprot:CAMPEP_0175242440 /NCGR_PEP_ID=MMETSP0093-20121207/31067_1 /TAXON_ID=311494 /ORGANISM="Alexandrium monilatum, Strain CCMP3105" /LENGTH=50 /DNA_ID=CAMNT_0016536511 /DNA_START=89 /DNA_END=237 /DNA_ORIENTATION=-
MAPVKGPETECRFTPTSAEAQGSEGCPFATRGCTHMHTSEKTAQSHMDCT